MRASILSALVLLGLTLAGVSWWLFSSDFGPDEYSESSETQTPAPGYQLRPRHCDFDVPWRANIQCLELLSPEMAGAELRFRLPVVIIRAGQERRPDPILYLQGGPGAPARLHREGINAWLSWLDYAGFKRDLVLLDRRGAGRSQPVLDCPAYDRFSREILRENASLEQELEQGSAILKACFERLSQKRGIESDQFGTEVSAQDVAALMALLDYDQWNLIGVSYGSRLAMAVAGMPQVHEAGWVRSLILDSVYPPDQGGLLTWPRVMTEGLEHFFEGCEEAESCNPGRRNLNTELNSALKALAREPMTLSVPLWQERRSMQIVVNDHRLLSAIFAAVNHRHRWPDIPQALAAVRERDSERLIPLIEPFINLALDEDFSSLAFMAVDCRDHPLGTEADYQAQLKAFPRFSPYLEPLWRWQTCQWLGAAQAPLELAPEALARPTLMLAGELDPVTPSSWAQRLAEAWPESQLYVAEGSGHSVIGSEPCVHRSLVRFLDDPEEEWEPNC